MREWRLWILRWPERLLLWHCDAHLHGARHGLRHLFVDLRVLRRGRRALLCGQFLLERWLLRGERHRRFDHLPGCGRELWPGPRHLPGRCLRQLWRAQRRMLFEQPLHGSEYGMPYQRRQLELRTLRRPESTLLPEHGQRGVTDLFAGKRL